MYYLLTESFKELEHELVRRIVNALPVDIVYMLGSTLRQQRTESVFAPETASCRSVGHYWLLVLVSDADRGNSQLQDMLENACRSVAPITILVLDCFMFSQWIRQGHPFAAAVNERGVKLYQHPQVIMPTGTSREAVGSLASGLAPERFLATGREFMAGAELYHQQDQYYMAAFMLHQCAENALHALLKKTTGLHMNTHNLDKLLRYCAMVTPRVLDILPRNNEADKKRFQLLQAAYVDSRYKQRNNINSMDMDILMDRVRAMCQLASAGIP